MISVTYKGNMRKVDSYLQRLKKLAGISNLNRYGEMGVKALSSATPTDSGITAQSWDYKIERKKGYVRLVWTNSNVNDGVPIAIILQYGHANRSGSYLQGTDYINGAMAPVFEKIKEDFCEEVRRG